MPAAPPGTIIQTIPDENGVVVGTVTQHYNPTTRAMIDIITENTTNKRFPVTVVRMSDGAEFDVSIRKGTRTYDAAQLASFGINEIGDISIVAGSPT